MMELNKNDSNNYEIKLAESFDFENHVEFRGFVKKIMSEKPKHLSIDFTNVEYIDSSALGMLMLAKHEAERNDCSLKLSNVKDGHAKDVLYLVKFNQLFDISEA